MEPNYTVDARATARRVIARLVLVQGWRALSFAESRQLAAARRTLAR